MHIDMEIEVRKKDSSLRFDRNDRIISESREKLGQQADPTSPKDTQNCVFIRSLGGIYSSIVL